MLFLEVIILWQLYPVISNEGLFTFRKPKCCIYMTCAILPMHNIMDLEGAMERMDKFVLFDFDGVIINSHVVQRQALEVSYRSICGEGEVPYDDFFKLSGDSLENIFTKLNLPLEMAAVYRAYSSRHIDSIIFNKEFIDVFESLKKKKVQCVLCTGKERKRTIQLLKHFGIEHYFVKVVCSDDVKHPKPNPESVEVVKQTYQLKDSQLIFVGDGINDIHCARNANVKIVAVSWGDIKREALEMECPDELVDSIEELRDSLEKWVNE